MTLESGASVRLVLTTCPDEEVAVRIARALVEERLAACGNVVSGVTSVYRWQGAITEAGEWLLLLKAPAARVEALAARLEELHPYDVPEILVLEIERGAGAYLQWVLEETAGDG